MRTKWFLASSLAVLLLAGFVTTSLISYHVAKDSIVQQLEEQMLPLTSDTIYSEIQRDLLQPLLISSLMANDTFVNDWARAGEHDPQRMVDYLAHIRHKYGTITSFFVSEETRLYYHPEGVVKRVNSEDPADAWYFRIREANEDYEINVDQDTAEPSRVSVFVNYRVIDKDGEFVGVTGVGLSMDTVALLIENYQQRYGREVYFVNRAGEVTLHSSQFDKNLHLSNKDGLDKLFTRILTSPSSSVRYQMDNGNTIYLNSRLIPEFNWFLVVEQTNEPGTAQVEGALITNVLVSIAISLVVLLIAHVTFGGYQRRLEAMATRDKLTGATSRQVFDDIYQRASKRAERKGSPLCLITMDIDNFKQINDRFGHHCGDEVIRTTAEIITGEIRDSDVLCRWGGEEFLLLLKDCSRKRALTIAERIRVAVADREYYFADDALRLTISLGVAQQVPGESQDELLRRCDEALYRSKREGRNRISLAEDNLARNSEVLSA